MKKRIFALLFAFLLLCGCGLPVYDTGDGAASVPDDTGADFSILFLDVGQADSILVRCGGESMLIDGGNVEDSDRIHAVLQREGLEALDYVVCTHAHEDHCGGLAAALEYASVGTLYAPVTEYDSACFRSMVKYAQAQSLSITVPQPDLTFSLGDALVTVLGPRRDYDDTNDTSIVLRIDYEETSFLLCGDMESDAEADLLEDGCDVSADLMKVGHHGSSTSTSYRFLREVMPEYAVISAGAGNSYGHPHEETLSRLSDAGVQVWRTDECGDILCQSDGKTVTLSSDKSAPTPSVEDTAAEYIGNLSSHKFHLPTCGGLPEEQNRIYFSSRQEAVEAGYEPCGKCKP